MTWRPEQGMRLVQALADLPGLGETELLVDAPFGGALLIPFANRIRGRLAPDGMIATQIAGKDVRLPANWQGARPGGERCAIHGLALQSRFDLVHQSDDRVIAELDAGDFDGHWLSRAHVRVEALMRESALDITVEVRNAGDEVLPVGIGWHPYFRLPSGRREQARLYVPARARALVNNYDEVFPTGEVRAVAGTPYDFTAAGGAALGTQYLDDCFVDLVRDEDESARIQLTDPASGYAMRLTAFSAEVRAVQVYAPPGQPFVVIEPQFNLADPFAPLWPSTVDTGMVRLLPQQQVSWHVRWELLH